MWLQNRESVYLNGRFIENFGSKWGRFTDSIFKHGAR